MPLPAPSKGNKYLALEYNIGFLAIDVPNLICATVSVFGNLPGLIISTRLSKQKL